MIMPTVSARYSIRRVAILLLRGCLLLTTVAGVYLGLFFAWLTAGPGAPYEKLYARRAEIWLTAAGVAFLAFGASFLIWRGHHHGDA